MRGGWFNRTQHLASQVIWARNRADVLGVAHGVLNAEHGPSAWCAAGKDLAPMVLDAEGWPDAVAFARAICRGPEECPVMPAGVEELTYDPMALCKEWNPSGPSVAKTTRR